MEAENGVIMEMSLSRKFDNIVDHFSSVIWFCLAKSKING